MLQLKLTVSATFYYSDSQITLAWIKSPSYKWKTYVANRVEQIQKISEVNNWYYVASKYNPADCASRGQLPEQLITNELWWKGPEWLYSNNYKNTKSNSEYHTQEEIRSKQVVVKHVQVSDDLLDRFSTLTKAIHVIAICKRFTENTKDAMKNGRKNIEIKNKQITFDVDDLEKAKITIIQMCQHQHFKMEINLLNSKKPILHGKLKSLFPFIDNRGLLRVGGRLQNSEFEFNKKHPIIIPRNCNLAFLIIHDSHRITLHGGNQLTLAQIRHQFWVLGARGLVKKFINKCVTCYRFRSTSVTQLMGSLPSDRTKILIKPFTNCGVDLCGPVWVKVSGERHIRAKKGYIVLFICFATKAVHIEIVSDLTAEAFYAAFKRLIARVGNVKRLYYDNGTNFVGTKNILNLESETAIKKYNEDIHNKLLSHNTQFIFNPPAAPWFGGLWERHVGSIKHHLKRVVADRKLTYEELATVVQQIEACLNSRPLCPLSDNPEDIEALTPSHLLIGFALMAPLEMDLKEEKECRLTRWELCKRLRQDFWAKWSNEYVSQLQIRSKWVDTNENIEIGDMVLLKDENTAPLYWPLGRIKQVYPGNDGLVRVVDVLSNGKVYKRAIGKITLLPVKDEEKVKNAPCEKENSALVTNNNDPEIFKKEKPNIEIKGKKIHNNSVKGGGSTIIWAFICFGLIASITGKHQNFNIVELNQSPGAVFDQCEDIYGINGHWHVISEMDMETYFGAYKSITDGTDQLTTLCEKIKKNPNGTHCESLVMDVNEHLNKISENNIIIKSGNDIRGKRGIFWKALAGSAIGYLGGAVIDFIRDDSNRRELNDISEKTQP